MVDIIFCDLGGNNRNFSIDFPLSCEGGGGKRGGKGEGERGGTGDGDIGELRIVRRKNWTENTEREEYIHLLQEEEEGGGEREGERGGREECRRKNPGLMGGKLKSKGPGCGVLCWGGIRRGECFLLRAQIVRESGDGGDGDDGGNGSGFGGSSAGSLGFIGSADFLQSTSSIPPTLFPSFPPICGFKGKSDFLSFKNSGEIREKGVKFEYFLRWLFC